MIAKPENIMTASYFLDLFVKSALAICVAVASWQFKSIDSRIATAEEHGAAREVRLSVLESINLARGEQLRRIEDKLDRVLEMAKKAQ